MNQGCQLNVRLLPCCPFILSSSLISELCQELQFNAESCNEAQHVLADCKVNARKLSPWCCPNIGVCVCVCLLALSMRVREQP